VEELVAKTELEREAARLERELQDLEGLLTERRERLSALSPLPVYWRWVRCGKDCRHCPHGPYPYLRVKKEGKWRWEYLGKGWQPPEGFTRPQAFREELALYRALLKRKEELLERLEKAKEALRGW